MITFKLTKQNFNKSTFVTRKDIPISKTLNNFGYIRYFDFKKETVVIEWYNNFNKSEIKVRKKDLFANYKSIYPYYNTKFSRGNIWKYSYETLLSKIDKEKGFCNIKVDKMTYKKVPIKGNNVIITDAVYVLGHNITKLQGVIKAINKKEYTIQTQEGKYVMNRCSFALLPQDYFILLSIRCY